MPLRLRLSLIALVVCWPSLVFGQVVAKNPPTLAWDPSPGADAYHLKVGAQTYTIPAPSTTFTTPILAAGTYTATISAFNTGGESVFVPVPPLAFVIPQLVDPACLPPLGNRVPAIFVTALQKTGSGGALSKARLDFQLASPNSPIVHVAVKTLGLELPGAAADGAAPNYVGPLAGLWFTVPATPGTYPLSVTATNLYGCTNDVDAKKSVTVP